MMLISYDISRSRLYRSKPEDLLRLAKWLGLKRNLDKMSHRQLSHLVRWRITRRWERRM